MCALLLLSEGQATEQVEEPADLLGSQVVHVVQDTLQPHTNTHTHQGEVSNTDPAENNSQSNTE